MDRFLKRPRSAAPASGASIDASGGSGSRFCACPVCGKNVPFATINQHLDSPQCTVAGATAGAAEVPATAATVPRALPGVARMSAAPEPASQSSATPEPAASCAKDSLSMLMQGARRAARSLHCTLGSEADGWPVVWRWSDDPSPPAAPAAGWSAQMTLRGSGVRLHLHCPPPADGPVAAWVPGAGCGCTAGASLLKSALQKNVRLCRPTEAVRVGWALARLRDAAGRPVGLGELLRRVPIIAVEDALPPEEIGAVVFLSAAHAKGMAISPAHVRLLMRVVWRIAATRWREEAVSDNLAPLTLADDALGAGADLSRALLLREALGGMRGDAAMLRGAARRWLARLGGGRAAWWCERLRGAIGDAAPASDGALEDEGAPLRASDFPPSCVDFHCSNVLDAALGSGAVRARLAELAPPSPDALLDLAKTAMWRFSSSRSEKREWADGACHVDVGAARADDAEHARLQRAWGVLEPACRDFAHGHIRRCLGPGVGPLGQRMPPARAPPPAAAHAPAAPVAHASLGGLWLVSDFISESEETELIRWLDGPATAPWVLRNFNGPARGKRWGVRTDLRRRTVTDDCEGMPPQLDALAARMQLVAPSALGDFWPNEANALDYDRAAGHHIAAHCDDRQLSGEVLVNLSLCGDAFMTYTHDRKPLPPVRVRLPRRSLQIQTGDVRFNWRHAIENADLCGPRRVSLTFRRAAVGAATGSAPTP